MIVCTADKSGQVLTISYSQHVTVDEMKRFSRTIRQTLKEVKPGFFLLTDLTSLESMDASCASDLGAVMDLCCASGMSTVVRVIPDPYKEIGFNLISRFHLQPQTKMQTHVNLAEAIKSLLAEQIPMDVAPA